MTARDMSNPRPTKPRSKICHCRCRWQPSPKAITEVGRMMVNRMSWNNSSLSQPNCVIGRRVSNTGIARQCARQTVDRLMPKRSSHPVSCLVCVLFIAGFIPQSLLTCLGLPLKQAWHKRSKVATRSIHRASGSEPKSNRRHLYLLGGYLAGRRYLGDRSLYVLKALFAV